MSRRIECPTCRGRRYVEPPMGERETCPTCDGEGKIAVERTASYDLGRARGIVTGRAEPTERDAEWWAAQPGVDGDDDYAYDDFGDGMLDGRDQATSRKLGLPCPDPPSPEALAAAREGTS